jgi:hypothetical protein
VHDYSDRFANPSSALAGSGAIVTLYLASGVTQVFPVPNLEGTLWTVFELSGGTVTPVDTMSYTSDPFTVSSFSVVRRAIGAIQTDASVIRDAVNAHRK